MKIIQSAYQFTNTSVVMPSDKFNFVNHQKFMENLREYIAQLRHDFSKLTLDESVADPDGVKQFEQWFRQAVEARVNEPNAFVLSTVGTDLRPSARILLLRDFNDGGLVFYTNYRSRKAREIDQNPFACMTFFWPELERQVRIEGKLMKQSAESSDQYFASRPRTSRLGAWASPQSEPLPARETLDQALAALEKRFEGQDVPRPEWWGGYVLMPETIEFWQGRPSRLHDRLVYHRDGLGWKIGRIAP